MPTAPIDLLSPALLGAVAAFLTALSLALLTVIVLSRRSERIRARLARHTVSISREQVQRSERVQVLARQPRRGSALRARLARLQTRFSFVERARVDLRHANLEVGVGRYFLIRLALGAVAFGLAQIVTGSLAIAAGAAVAAFVVPRFVVKRKGSRRASAFEGQLAEAIDVIVGSLRAGHGLVQAIDSASHEQPEPMRTELERLVNQINMGIGIGDALELLTKRFDSRDVDLLAAAVTINRQTGGNLTEVLQNLAGTVRQRREIREEAKSLTAAPRATGYILAILPFAITAYTTAMSPIYREQLFHNPLGRVLLIGSIVWSLIGFFISQKLAKVEY